MISKTELLKWFQNLESFERIETVYSLLLVCLPFECRFLGTCLEELGRHNANDLRIMETRANSAHEISDEMEACANGDPTDFKARRKMALYVALIRACNRTCSYEIFRALEAWGDFDFDSLKDQDTLLELLLIYTMAANHPVFSFEQQTICGNILTKIKRNKKLELVGQQQPPIVAQESTPQMSTIADGIAFSQSSQQQQQQAITLTLSSQPDMMQQHALHAVHNSAVQPPHPLVGSQVQMLPQGSVPLLYSQQLHKHLPPSDGHLTNQMNVDGMPPPGLPPNIAIPTDSSAMIQPNAGWQLRSFVHTGLPVGMDQMQQPPPAASPLLSQQSSPGSSRATSPNRTSSSSSLHQNMSQTAQLPPPMRSIGQRMPGSLKSMRRPSAESTPPPMAGQHQQMMPSDLAMSHSVKQLDDVSENPGNALPNFMRNGYTRNAISQTQQRMKTGAYIPPHQQQQPSPVGQQQQFIAGNYVNTGLLYNMQNMNVSVDMHGTGTGTGGEMGGLGSTIKGMNVASDSGSSNGSCGDISPPQTPTQQMTNASVAAASLAGFNIYHHKPPNYIKHNIGIQQQHQQSQPQHRLNGRNPVDKGFSVAQPPLFSANDLIMGSTSQQHQPNSVGGIIGSNAIVTVNQSMPSSTMLISSSSAGGAPAVILQGSQQQQQQQATAFNSNYPYHAATSRPPPPPTPLLSHNAPAHMAAQPIHNSFRFPMPPNGDMVFAPQYHHQSLAFLPAGGGPPPPQPASGQQLIRSSNPNNPASVIVSANIPGPNAQAPAQQQQQSSLLATASAAPYSTLAVCPITGNSTSQKTMSCFNCGSQTHTGRDCSEASMEDVTRSRDYKLDYCPSETGSTDGSSCGSNCGDQKHPESMANFSNQQTATTPTTGAAILQSNINAVSGGSASSIITSNIK